MATTLQMECARHMRDAFYFMVHRRALGMTNQAQFDHLLSTRFWRAEMAAKSAAAARGVNPKPNNVQEAIKFVNRNLTDQEKRDHDAQLENIAGLALEWVKLALSGYSTKISWDSYSKCFQATLTVWNDACVNFGYGLSARGATPERACSLLLYKHFHILNENWAEAYTPRAADFEG